MFAKQAINTDIKPLSPKDTIDQARLRMEQINVTTLPVVDETTGKLVGQVGAEMFYGTDPHTPVSELQMEEAVKIYLNQHIFEAARLMLQYELRLLSVVDGERVFKGMVEKHTVLESLTHMLNLAEYGSVITLELVQRDFTLSEIVHIIETEGAKILGITVEQSEPNEGSFKVSIKLNLKDVSRVAAALRRYDYAVLTESASEPFGRDIEHRADELIKYLDM